MHLFLSTVYDGNVAIRCLPKIWLHYIFWHYQNKFAFIIGASPSLEAADKKARFDRTSKVICF